MPDYAHPDPPRQGGDCEPTLQEIRAAAQRISSYIHHTPVLTNRTIDRLAGADVVFKCENLQKVGAFKIRGATNAVFALCADEAARGVATHSSGNHGAALAQAAAWRGIKATVVMPSDAPEIKKQALAHYGADIVYCEPTLQAREDVLAQVIERSGAVFVHPYDDYRIIAGQATVALELCEEIADLDVIIAPVGGGGLLSATALAVHSIRLATDVLGAEPENVDDACRSLQAGRIIPVARPASVADGLLTSLGDLTFPIIKRYVRGIVTVSEAQIIAAMRLIWERMKLIIEPSAAVGVAAVLKQRRRLAQRRVGVILSGGNVDLDKLPWSARDEPADERG